MDFFDGVVFLLQAEREPVVVVVVETIEHVEDEEKEHKKNENAPPLSFDDWFMLVDIDWYSNRYRHDVDWQLDDKKFAEFVQEWHDKGTHYVYAVSGPAAIGVDDSRAVIVCPKDKMTLEQFNHRAPECADKIQEDFDAKMLCEMDGRHGGPHECQYYVGAMEECYNIKDRRIKLLQMKKESN
jgi:hypothetical protein